MARKSKVLDSETVSNEIISGTPKKVAPPVKKKKGKPRGDPEAWKKSPVIGMNGYNLTSTDKTSILFLNIELMNMPDIDLNNVDEVAQRLSDYFALYAKYELKPTVVGMAIALNGHNRQWLWGAVHDKPISGNGAYVKLPQPVSNLIKKTYNLLENQWESYMNSGKINPVSGIFLGKNHYGYRDQVENIITPNVNEEEINVEEIRERYLVEDTNDSDK